MREEAYCVRQGRGLIGSNHVELTLGSSGTRLDTVHRSFVRPEIGIPGILSCENNLVVREKLVSDTAVGNKYARVGEGESRRNYK